MDNETATAMAVRTGLKAARAGLDLTNKGDPDVGELITSCRRHGVPIESVLIGE